MKNKVSIKWLFILIFCVFFYGNGKAQKFTTLTYFSNDSIQVEMDLFLPEDSSLNNFPLVIFVHGGGFSGGNKKDGHLFANYLSKNGIACASIDYTLYMKDKSFGCDGQLSEKIKAIQIPVNQVWKATSFLLDRYEEFGFNKSQIFLSGNSAGGETILHAAYWSRKEMQLLDHGLEESFKYAGLISGAGAIMDLNLIDQSNLLPSFFFHGAKDKLVPYDTAAHHFCPPNSPGWLMLFGSHSITNHLIKMEGRVELITFQKGGHEYHNFFFRQEQHRVSDFIEAVLSNRIFKKQENYQIED